jgi:hypothetical protein
VCAREAAGRAMGILGTTPSLGDPVPPAAS